MKFLYILAALFAFAVPAQAANVTVTIKADAPVVSVSSNDGYTVTLTNSTPNAIDAIPKFLLPGHGVPPIDSDVMGNPGDSDLTAAFTYVADSSDIGNPAINDTGRWLTFPHLVLFPGDTTFHFNVVVSPNQAYYTAGATALADASVLGTKKGAMIQVVADSNLNIWTTADRTCVSLGGTVKWTTHLSNAGSDDVTIESLSVGTHSGVTYIKGSSDGFTNDDPRVLSTDTPKVVWDGPFTLPAGQTIAVTYSMKYNATRKTGVRARAILADLPDLGQGPEAKVKVGC